MKVLVINAGSSSLKYQLFNMENESVLAKGNCERIGIDGLITHKTDKDSISYEASFPTHAEALQEVVKCLTTGDYAVVDKMEDITAVGHRVVQGGEKFNQSCRITPELLDAVETLSELAPLHNPPILMAIRACLNIFAPTIPQVGVFDTSFHQTIPEKAYIYAIPYEYYEKYRIRRYGFHGTSHRYVTGRFAEITGRPASQLKIVTCHLGNGSSIAAVDGGKSVDTTMGFTPLEGLIMGTRSGSIDPSIVTYLQEKENLSAQGVGDILNKKSGYLGVSGVTSDQRDLIEAAESGNARAQLALDIQRYQLKKYIGAYAAVMGGLDAVIFTGGIGENSGETRRDACAGLEFMGIKIDDEKNAQRGEVKISTADSTVEVWVVPTNEELLIARDTVDIAGK